MEISSFRQCKNDRLKIKGNRIKIAGQAKYRMLHNNVAVEFRPSDYVNHPAIISQHNKLVAINFARTMDLSGQVYADALPHNHFSGITGMFDFMMKRMCRPDFSVCAEVSSEKIWRVCSR